MRKIFWFSALAVSALAGPASAQDDWMGSFDHGGAWYLGLKLGGNFMAQDYGLSKATPNGPIRGVDSFDDQYFAGFEGGYAFNNGFALEFEFAYRYNQNGNVTPYGKARGAAKSYAEMVNAIYTIPVDWTLKPYVGFGLGAGDFHAYRLRADGMPYPAEIGGDPTGFALQAIVGTSYDLTDNISLQLEYRYFEIEDEKPRGILNQWESHSILLGVKYTFGEPPPPPPAAAPYAPPPAVQQSPSSYLVFFDFNKSDLTDQAQQIVDQAAQNAQSGHVTQMTVTGHTDTVGSDAYNMRLSRRRAESVAARLEKDGVPSSEIEIVAKGKRDLLVPTADGVREPQNRRVQIVFGGGTPSS
jgi:outer membrane protein OmpA-like peptidoglycan-associated protein